MDFNSIKFPSLILKDYCYLAKTFKIKRINSENEKRDEAKQIHLFKVLTYELKS
jgi:hypothetical protein